MKDWESKKEKLFQRDRARCQCCSKKLTLHSMTLGHRVVKAISKSNQLPNLQLECVSCNREKNKLNKKYLRKAKKFIKSGEKLQVSIHPVTYNRIDNEGNIEWFEENNYTLIQNKNVMIGDFAVL